MSSIPKVAFLGWIKTWGKLSALPTFFGLATLEIRKPSEHLVNLLGNQLTSTVKWSEVLLIGAKLKTASSLMSSVCWSRRLEVDDEELSPPSKSLTRTSNSSSSSASMASTASTASSSLLRSRDAVKTWSKRTEWVWQKQSIINFQIRNSVHLYSSISTIFSTYFQFHLLFISSILHSNYSPLDLLSNPTTHNSKYSLIYLLSTLTTVHLIYHPFHLLSTSSNFNFTYSRLHLTPTSPNLNFTYSPLDLLSIQFTFNFI